MYPGSLLFLRVWSLSTIELETLRKLNYGHTVVVIGSLTCQRSIGTHDLLMTCP